MKLCLRITFSVGVREGLLQKYVLKQATKLGIEGTAQFIDSENVRVIACGLKEHVDDFVDALHQGSAKYELDDIQLEPFPKGRDYRGAFRVIE